jgi:hypothetical protein
VSLLSQITSSYGGFTDLIPPLANIAIVIPAKAGIHKALDAR